MLIQQRHSYDCSFASGAMLLGVSYERMCELAGFAPTYDDVITSQMMAHIAIRQGHKAALLQTRECASEFGNDSPKQFLDSSEMWTWLVGKRAQLNVPSNISDEVCHAVYWDGASLHDPAQTIVYGPHDRPTIWSVCVLFD